MTFSSVFQDQTNSTIPDQRVNDTRVGYRPSQFTPRTANCSSKVRIFCDNCSMHRIVSSALVHRPDHRVVSGRTKHLKVPKKRLSLQICEDICVNAFTTKMKNEKKSSRTRDGDDALFRIPSDPISSSLYLFGHFMEPLHC